ncbi:MAG: hypothetical protein IJF15_02925 [Oscillospiraceae bacterium]|nr:hypothetical protein [Oscillospiraceae bacterium]
MGKYRYNDPIERKIKVNRFFLLACVILFSVLGVYFYLYEQEVRRGMWTVWANIGVLVGFLLIDAALFLKNKASSAMRIVASIEVFILYIVYSMVTPASFLGMALMGVMGVCIAYFDTKFFNLVFVASFVNYVACQIIRSSIGVTEANANGVCQVIMNAAVFVMLQRIASITKRFSDDALGSIAEQKEVQDKMVGEMVLISQSVKDESDRSHSMMEKMLASARQTASNTQEISLMSSSIADDLDEQTRMTREIQGAIGATRELSQEMVELAGDSNRQISENHVMMQDLREQSNHISVTNAQVTEAMERLQEKTEEVSGFADIILNVSSETNLLALNASVESARVGEAGKGFSVIAGQIRKLAEETRQSAENISTIVGDLRANEEAVVKLVSVSVAASEKQHGMVQTTAEMIANLEQNLQHLVENIGQIDGKIENLSISNDAMVDSISNISASTETVSANAEETKDLTSQNLRYAQSTGEAIDTIQKTASRLEKFI